MTQHLVTSWQGLVQQLVNLMGHGYYYVAKSYYPTGKDWDAIDRKLISKYACDVEKSKRWRARKEGVATFAFLRLAKSAYILHTEGGLPRFCESDPEPFIDTRKTRLTVRVGPYLVITIGFNGNRVDVRLTKTTYKSIKERLSEVAKSGVKGRLVSEFKKLDGIPVSKGTVAQKSALATWLIKEAKVYKIRLTRSDLQFSTRRIPVKVYQTKPSR